MTFQFIIKLTDWPVDHKLINFEPFLLIFFYFLWQFTKNQTKLKQMLLKNFSHTHRERKNITSCSFDDSHFTSFALTIVFLRFFFSNFSFSCQTGLQKVWEEIVWCQERISRKESSSGGGGKDWKTDEQIEIGWGLWDDSKKYDRNFKALRRRI